MDWLLRRASGQINGQHFLNSPVLPGNRREESMSASSAFGLDTVIL